MTIDQAQQQLLFQLYHLYDNREAANIADWIMEHITSWKKIDRIVHKQVPLLPEKIALLDRYTHELLTHKPVQYVLHEAWFYGMALYVNEAVLIPRPETEELVEWVVDSSTNKAPGILDIGTGSGCISIALKKKMPDAAVYACDVSKEALAVAARNTQTLQAAVQFIQLNFLEPAAWEKLPAVDIIVSNPPYVPQSNKAGMQPNVLQYEPHLALFVENDDPLLFYKAIAGFAALKLLPGGSIYAEIHEDLGQATKELFVAKGFANVELKKDMQGKDRMIRAGK